MVYIYLKIKRRHFVVVVKNVTCLYEFERDERREREEDLKISSLKKGQKKTLFIIPHNNTFCLSSSVINKNKNNKNERTRHISSQLWLLFISIFSGRVLVS